MTDLSKKFRIREQIRLRRTGRVKATIRGTTEKPRLVVHRSLRHINAQIINDHLGKTIVSAYDREIKSKVKGIELATAVGKLIAERAIEKKISSIVFDRRSHRYHGRIKALAEAVRESGVKF